MTSRSSLAALLGAAALAAACGRSEPAGLISASGHVEATQVRIAAKTPGTLAMLRVDEGDRVAAGQPVAEVDTVDVRLALDAARYRGVDWLEPGEAVNRLELEAI